MAATIELPEGFVLDNGSPDDIPSGFNLDDPEPVGRTSQEIEKIQQQRISNLPELTGILSGERFSQVLATTPALITATDPAEFANIVTANFPNVGAVVPGPGQDPVLVNNETGVAVQINRKGFSPLDVLQGLGIASAFAPGAAGLTGTSARALGSLAATAGTTQAGIETLQKVAGGEFDLPEVGVAAVTAPVGEVVGEKLLAPLARAVGGQVSQGSKDLLRMAKERGIDVLTTDVVPPNTFLGKTVQHLGEKLGPIGTGLKRAKQQNARIEVVEDIAEKFNVSLDAPIERNIIKSLNRGILQRKEKAALLRNEAVEVLDQFGAVDLDKTIKSIDEQIAKQVRLKRKADPQIIDNLTRLKQSLADADFSLVKDLRSSLIDDINASFSGEINALPSKAVAPLQAVKSTIDKDLKKFAVSKDRVAASKWIRSNRIFAEGYRKVKETELKRVLKKGDMTPEVVNSIMLGGKASELTRLDSLLDEAGKKNARTSIITSALKESGFFQGGANPTRFVNAMQKPSRQKAFNVFFKGAQKKEVEGLTRLLSATSRAQEASVSTATGQQLFAPLTALAGAQFDAGISFGTAGTLGALTRSYEGSGVRNLILKLANTPKGSNIERELLDELMPFVQGTLQGFRASLQENE